MFNLFEYNWQVRTDWFDWCDLVTEKELLKKRTGGSGSVLYKRSRIFYTRNDRAFSYLNARIAKRRGHSTEVQFAS